MTTELPSNQKNASSEAQSETVSDSQYNPDLYTKGNFYIELKPALARCANFKTQAYVYGRGVVDIEKSEHDPQRIQIIADKRSKHHEPRLDDEIYFEPAFIHSLIEKQSDDLKRDILSKMIERDIKAVHADVASITDEQKAAAVAALQEFKLAEGITKPKAANDNSAEENSAVLEDKSSSDDTPKQRAA